MSQISIRLRGGGEYFENPTIVDSRREKNNDNNKTLHNRSDAGLDARARARS